MQTLTDVHLVKPTIKPVITKSKTEKPLKPKLNENIGRIQVSVYFIFSINIISIVTPEKPCSRLPKL